MLARQTCKPVMSRRLAAHTYEYTSSLHSRTPALQNKADIVRADMRSVDLPWALAWAVPGMHDLGWAVLESVTAEAICPRAPPVGVLRCRRDPYVAPEPPC